MFFFPSKTNTPLHIMMSQTCTFVPSVFCHLDLNNEWMLTSVVAITQHCAVSQWVTVCVGEWSRRQWHNTTFVHARQGASSLVIRQWRSRVGCWLLEWSHSTAEQSTTTTARPRRQKLSSQAVVANTIMLQRTHITTHRCTQQQQWVVAAVWRHLTVCSTLTNGPMSAWVQPAMSLYISVIKLSHRSLSISTATTVNLRDLFALPTCSNCCDFYFSSYQLVLCRYIFVTFYVMFKKSNYRRYTQTHTHTRSRHQLYISWHSVFVSNLDTSVDDQLMLPKVTVSERIKPNGCAIENVHIYCCCFASSSKMSNQ